MDNKHNDALLALADEMKQRMTGGNGKPHPKPVYGVELMEWARRIEALAEQPAGAVPEGFVLVPREAPVGMLEALSLALYEDVRLMWQRERFRNAYAAMLAAAPAAAPTTVTRTSPHWHGR